MIKRFTPTISKGMEQYSKGEYVLTEDHIEEVDGIKNLLDIRDKSLINYQDELLKVQEDIEKAGEDFMGNKPLKSRTAEIRDTEQYLLSLRPCRLCKHVLHGDESMGVAKYICNEPISEFLVDCDNLHDNWEGTNENTNTKAIPTPIPS